MRISGIYARKDYSRNWFAIVESQDSNCIITVPMSTPVVVFYYQHVLLDDKIRNNSSDHVNPGSCGPWHAWLVLACAWLSIAPFNNNAGGSPQNRST